MWTRDVSGSSCITNCFAMGALYHITHRPATQQTASSKRGRPHQCAFLVSELVWCSTGPLSFPLLAEARSSGMQASLRCWRTKAGLLLHEPVQARLRLTPALTK